MGAPVKETGLHFEQIQHIAGAEAADNNHAGAENNEPDDHRGKDFTEK